MKTIILIVAVALIPVMGSAQKQVTDNFFKKYSGKEGFTTVNISEKLFELFAAVEDEESDQYDEMLTRIKGLNILVYENKDKQNLSAKYFNEINTGLQSGYYSELMTIKDGADDVRLLVKESDKKGVITQLLLIVNSAEEFVFINLEGEIDLNEIKDISKSINAEGMEHLEKIDKK